MVTFDAEESVLHLAIDRLGGCDVCVTSVSDHEPIRRYAAACTSMVAVGLLLVAFSIWFLIRKLG